MRKILILGSIIGSFIAMNAQTSPAITSWLQNTTETGSYYSTTETGAQENGILVNCQQVSYSDDYVYIQTTGVPAYITGPFQDGNPSNATDQEATFQIPLNPVENTGTATETTAGRIAIFINGAGLYDYRDGVSYTDGGICGGPGNDQCPRGATLDWNRDAVPAEKEGFDCAKGHPAMGDYHHHQNPTAFDLDLVETSDVCDLYDADGLYVLDSTIHSPLIGFAYDGFPIYGAYGYKNTDGTGDIVRIKSSYDLATYSVRTHNADGTDVEDGPDVDETFFLGYFKEDYTYNARTAPDYLDEHNGRICVTPEYPNGTYAYFATVDEDWLSAYPYAVGPTFYGVYANRSVDNVSEVTTVYEDVTGLSNEEFNNLNINIYPNPSSDFIAVQMDGLVTEDMTVDLLDMTGQVINSGKILKGSTLAFFDIQTLYNGNYLIKVSNGKYSLSEKIVVEKD